MADDSQVAKKRLFFLINAMTDAIPPDKHYTTGEVMNGVEMILVATAAMDGLSLKQFDTITRHMREEFVAYLEKNDRKE